MLRCSIVLPLQPQRIDEPLWSCLCEATSQRCYSSAYILGCSSAARFNSVNVTLFLLHRFNTVLTCFEKRFVRLMGYVRRGLKGTLASTPEKQWAGAPLPPPPVDTPGWDSDTGTEDVCGWPWAEGPCPLKGRFSWCTSDARLTCEQIRQISLLDFFLTVQRTGLGPSRPTDGWLAHTTHQTKSGGGQIGSVDTGIDPPSRNPPWRLTKAIGLTMFHI